VQLFLQVLALLHSTLLYLQQNIFNADAVEVTGWVSCGEYAYGPDLLRGSTTDPTNGYLQDLETENVVMGPSVPPSVTTPIKNFDPVLTLTALIRDYDPCDNSKSLGFPPECFIYYSSDYHLGDGDGEMTMFRSSLSTDNIYL